jgi:FtsP/CotA-like multicopper oxidase with cupredoxin domain
MVRFKQMKKVGKKVQLSLIAVLLAATSIPSFMGGTNIPTAKAADAVTDYFTTPNYANSPLPEFDSAGNIIPGTGIRKFVDGLPGLGKENANNLGQYMPVAEPDTTTFPGTDYYEISLVEYSEKLHSDLPATKLRGYKQTNTNKADVSIPSYLGPVIVAHKDRPVRIKFKNELPTGSGGDLFIPVDESLMGAGMGPDGMSKYTQNRATLHLHGGITPWISDGTPHQWITPAGEDTPYPKGVSVRNVPDMPDPGDGSMTFYYSNQQSARLMFYHDHSYGITRLNVYAGEAAGYLLRDQVEQDLIDAGVIPKDEIPLIIEDKTFVPKADQLAATDPTWDTTKWGGNGNLWFPHVYMPNQNPYTMSGANPMGRWDYGPWFWPPNTGLKQGPVDNPLYGQAGQPPKNPGVPNVSTTPEAFMDTPVINGTAYPTLTVDPKSYRFRILNAANDRMWNLQLYQAASSNSMWVKDANGELVLNDADAGEVAMVPAVTTPGFPGTSTGDPNDSRVWPSDGRAGGVPDPKATGPEMIQIGNESGFLTKPAILPNQPIDYEYGRRSITVLNVSSKNLLLGPAERADVIVDFSKYAGKTLILYNDAAAPVPAFDPRYDYYTGDPDQSVTGNNTGGAPTTQPGYGPNTRTIMQIKVAAAAPAPEYDLATLNTELPKAFKAGQNSLIYNNEVYNDNPADPINDPLAKWVNIHDNSTTFNVPGTDKTVTMNLTPKAIAEEFEQVYGRMNSTLGTEMPNTNFQNQTTIMLGYIDPTTENMTDSIAPIGELGDGTQIWKITHNGVDTHAIHFHLFDVQLINRVGWDGSIRMPDDNERGWKDTVRMNPLEDCIVALRPVSPKVPFGVPDSIRPLDPTMPLGTTGQFMNIDPLTGNPVTVTNKMTNYHWEYVWHCHLLGHEENDMMRPYNFLVTSLKPDASVLTAEKDVNGAVALTWTDPTPVDYVNQTNFGNPKNEVGYNVMRATITNGKVGTYTKIASILANNISYTDATADVNSSYSYRVDAFNTGTDTPNSTDPNSMYNGGTPSNAVVIAGTPLAPTNLSVTANGNKANLTWKDNATNETGFVVERSTDGVNFTQVATPSMLNNTGTVSYTDSNLKGGTYTYRVKAVNGTLASDYSNTASVTIASNPPPAPNAPSNLSVSLQNGPSVQLSWKDNATNETGFVIERSTDNGSTWSEIATPASRNQTGNMSYTDTNVTAGTKYTYRVKAMNGTTSSNYSNTASVTVPAPVAPSAPTGLNVNAYSNRGAITVAAYWSAPSGPVTSYEIQYATDQNFTQNVTLKTVTINSFTATSGFTSKRTYYFRVRAINQYGTSQWSAVRSKTMP